MDTSKFSFKPCVLFFLLIALSASCTKAPATKTGKTTKPNIVIFYVDDLGYGDVGCYGATRVSTPNIDKLASGGVRFTDGHSTAATCTPSRYSLLTGEYAFRNNAAILPGDAPLLIDTNQPTLPKMLQKAGYKTAVVGKWHLGLGEGTIDWNTEVKPGPLEVGFDYSFLLPATGDRVPTVYLENYKDIFESRNIHMIFLISPQTTNERLKFIDNISNGFVYMVSSSSTTGAKSTIQKEQEEYFNRVSNLELKNPRLIGFGISNHQTFKTACSYANGAIIGSAFVKALEGEIGLDDKIERFVEGILEG